MKKTLIALAVLGAAGVAHAQSNVVIYGNVDINYTKQTGVDATMSEYQNNRIGFQGVEDLGGGLKATFQLEHRFLAADGIQTGALFNGAANTGLAGGFGQVRFGRLNELSTETYRKLDPFNQYGVAGMWQTWFRGQNGNDSTGNGSGNGRLSDTIRYDSPNIAGFKLGGTFTLKNQSNGDFTTETAASQGVNANNGWAVSGTYSNGPLYVVANYNNPVNTNDSNNWNVGAAYAFGPAKVSLGYEQTKNKMVGDENKQKDWIVGLAWTLGPGVINASYNNSKEDVGSIKWQKFGIGYQHNLSKRTTVYANYAHTKADNTDADALGNSSINGFEIGMTHRF